MKLHLGCGDNYLSGWVNVDSESKHVDARVDLSKPWPWKDDSVDEILMEQVLEHFQRPEDILREVHRVLVPGGVITIEVPHATSTRAYSIDHKSFFTRCFFSAFSEEHYHTMRNMYAFEELSYHVKLVKLGRLRWTPFDFVASRLPFFWEKVSFGVFNPTEITWVARKPNNA